MLLESLKSNLYNLSFLISIDPKSICPLPCVRERRYLLLMIASDAVENPNVADAFDVPPEILSDSVK